MIDVKEVPALAQDMGLEVALDAQPLTNVQAADTRLRLLRVDASSVVSAGDRDGWGWRVLNGITAKGV